jgi:uncharacterized membrane protein YjgN (DUF898 family)
MPRLDISMNEAVTPPVPCRVTFSGRRADFVRLVVRGALLELVTVGFYRFWLATDIRRHLWSGTSVNGDAAEYIGTAKELFIGFLFALAILAPVYLVYFLIGVEAERLRAFASIPLGLFFYLFAQFAIYRARRYRLTRTVWRGVRFWMTGSGVNYALRAGLWALLTVLTLGLALPWARASLERYKMRHTAYGHLQGSFVATGGDLFRHGWWLWLLALLSLAPPVLAAWPPASSGRQFFVFLTLSFWLFLPHIFAGFKAIEWRWWVSGIRIGEVRFESDLTPGALIGLYWKVVGWGSLLMFVLVTWFGVVIGLAYASIDPASLASADPQTAMAERTDMVLRQIPVLVALGVGYAFVALMGGAVMRIYLMRDIWQRVAGSITVQNLAAADNVAARGDTVSALGEGFANSLDVTGF